MAEGKAVWTKFDENVSVSNVLLCIFMSKAGDVRCYILPHFFSFLYLAIMHVRENRLWT